MVPTPPNIPIEKRRFDTKVQWLKYKTLKEVAKHAFNNTLSEVYRDTPKEIVGDEPSMRCCIYKERAIVEERIYNAMGGEPNNPNVIQVLKIACDECPITSYQVTEACRGCIAHRCEENCHFGAISFDEKQKAHIDPAKCKECGKCAANCPYHAISISKRPCENACKVGAISMDEHRKASIDNDKCVSCGACVYQCPFGAISDRSFILDVIKLIKESDSNKKYKLYAVVAPSISSQFSFAPLPKVISGIKKLGFHSVLEAALGGDMVAWTEGQELVEKGFLTSSCCPGFVSYIEKQFPNLKEHISHNPSPMAALGKKIKELDPTAKVVFIGPCTAKKMEAQRENVKPYVDCVLTFEELNALLEAKEIDLNALEDDVLDNASYYGRIFARSGGLSDAVAESLKEQNITDFNLQPVICNGLEECRMTLLKANKNIAIAGGNFIEGMACVGGCIGGAGCLTHGPKDKSEVDKYGKQAMEKTISDAISVFGMNK